MQHLAKFAQFDFLLNDMQRAVENRIDDSGNGEQSTNNSAHIGCKMAE